MFRELVDLGHQLDREGRLPPTCFYHYAQPIRWIVHLWPDAATLEEASLFRPCPFGGRTNRPEAHLLADVAKYSLGIAGSNGRDERQEDGPHHALFRALYRSFMISDELRDPYLQEAISRLDRALEESWISEDPRHRTIRPGDWVSFVPEQGPLSATHLFEHPNAQAFWIAEMRRRCGADERAEQPPIWGMCSVCGRDNQILVRKLPLKVRLGGGQPNPLHSLNQGSFTSYIGGASAQDRSHTGVCFTCGELAARTFNFLSGSDQHRRQIARHPDPKEGDSLANHYALFWLRAPATIRTVEQEFDPNDLRAFEPGASISLNPERTEATLSQLLALLRQPWTPSDAAFRLDDYAFYLGIVSPNIGRIALREWLSVSLERLKVSLADFLEGTRIVSFRDGEVNPVSIAPMLEAVGASGADFTRALLRTAYTGTPPPSSLTIRAGQRLNHIMANERSLRERQRRRRRNQVPVWSDAWPQALAAAVKLGLFYREQEALTMTELNSLHRSTAYQCGRFLALLEEAQQLYTFSQYQERLEVSLVQRGYGGASTTPAPVFGRLLRLATVAHLPVAGGWINREVERISVTLTELGGIPDTLSLPEQAEFGLGFYHQRANIRAHWAKSDRKNSAAPTATDAVN